MITKPEITLNQLETEIFEIFYNFSKTLPDPPTLRVAGGWVRDKLLGLESTDIDFALDKMTGEEFVRLALEHYNSNPNGNSKENPNENPSGNPNSLEYKGFGVTKFNPEKSKNLEAAKIMVKGIWIDVVNLRGETYSSDSRIPSIEIGTPLQDAERRDLTINSLFFNLTSRQVEDHTGMGLSDLAQGIIRTPLGPYSTYMDDPLRILRTFRFASRFRYEVVEDIFLAAKKSEVKAALRNKVSRERVGIEMRSILSHGNAIGALRGFARIGLFREILAVDLENKGEFTNEFVAEYSRRIEQVMTFAENCERSYLEFRGNLRVLQEFHPKEEDIHFLTFLLSICLPFRGLTFRDKKKVIVVGPHLVKNSLKFTNKEEGIVRLNLEKAGDLYQLFFSGESINQGMKSSESQIQLAMILKELGCNWELCLFCSFLMAESAQIPNSKEIYASAVNFILQRKWERIFQMKTLIDVCLSKS